MATKKAETQKEELKRLKSSYEKDLQTKKAASGKPSVKSYTAAREIQRRFGLKSDYGTGKKAEDLVKSETDAFNARLNQKEQRIEDLKKSTQAKEETMRDTNSRAQYQHERDAGDPNALMLSFEEWKKL